MPDELNYFLSGGLAGMGGWLFAMPVSWHWWAKFASGQKLDD
jgi:hypothetical protein